MLKKFTASIFLAVLLATALPYSAFAAAGIFPSGGGTKTVGQTFTVTITASGAEFNAFQGTISVSGPLSVSSITAGSADTWMSRPSVGGTFSGALLGRKATSLTIATLKVKGTSVGKGAVTVSGVTLKNGATTVSNSGGSTSITIQKAPDLPGGVTVASSSHPDQNEAYEATTIALSWEKASGVDGFSYLLDQAEGTMPEAKITDAGTSVTYENQAIGVYYFHIRAHKPDGWGGTTHFKVTIKEPDPKINETLNKPSNIEIRRADSAINDIEKGELTGVVISGVTEAGYMANIKLDPSPTIPEGKVLSAKANSDGTFSMVIDFPLKAGYYKLTVQGQQEKVLTPLSDMIAFEISLKEGGNINFVTSDDILPPSFEPEVKGSFLKREYSVMTYLIFTLAFAVVLFGAIEMVRLIRRKRIKLDRI